MRNWVICSVCMALASAVCMPHVTNAEVPNPNVLWWTFDEGSGDTAVDVSGNGRDGVIRGAVRKAGGVGGLGGSLEFLGTGQTVEDEDAENYLNGLQALTIAVWIKSDVINTDKGFLWFSVPDGGDDGGMRYDAASWKWAGGTNLIKIALTGSNVIEGSDGKQTTQWQHVAMVWTAGKPLQLFLDGKADVPRGVDPATSSPLSGVTTLLIGKGAKDEDATESWDGMIDDVRIYDYALTDEQLKELAADKPRFLKAMDPMPANGATGVNTPLLQWARGESAIFHDVYFGADPDLTEADRVASRQLILVYFHVPGLQPGTTYYWRVDEIDLDGTVYQGDVWSFTAEPVAAFRPTPSNGADGLFPAPTLAWQPGKNAIRHHVYFGDRFADVNEAAAAADKGILTELKFNPGVLRSSTTYYWRIDEIKIDNAVVAGPVWSFTTADGVSNKIVRQWWSGITGTAISALTSSMNYPNNPTGSELLDTFEGPVDWADNYGTRMFGWLTPPQSGDYTFWISGDDLQELWLSTDADPANAVAIARVATYTTSQQWDKEAGQKSAPINLQAGRRYFIQALGKEGTGGDNIAVAWQGGSVTAQSVITAEYVNGFAFPPLQAFSPSPAHGAVDTIQEPVLSWSAGEKASQHDIYLGQDAAAVAAADTTSSLYKGRQNGTTFDSGPLEWGKTYYWRIDEIGDGPDSPWVGRVWSFTTAGFIAVDDFESYTDDEGSRIYQAWIDGYTNQNSGSTVGHLDAPFAEQTIVHGGRQSMPFDYNNVNPPYYSEAELEFSPVHDWTGNGLSHLSLWFRGSPVSFLETAPDSITLSAAGSDIWTAEDQFRFAFKRLNGNGSITAKVDSVMQTDPWAKAGVMIRETLDPASAFAAVYATPGNGVRYQARLQMGAQATSDTPVVTTAQTALKAPVWVRIERSGNALNGFYSTDGASWTPMSWNPQTIVMTGSVYLGLAVTSHNVNAVTTAQFSGIAAAGGATGPWQVAEIGADHPGNSRDELYVVLQDSTGKTGLAVHPDPAAVNMAAWTQWRIPLSDFSKAGVNLSRVKKLYLGVGDRTNPTPDGSGLLYIDDIRVVQPEPAQQ